jgi:hypothetical protein
MKTTLLLVLFVAALPIVVPAQTTVSPATNAAAAAVDGNGDKLLPGFTNSDALQLAPLPQPNPTTRHGGVVVNAEGALVRAGRAGRIWQAFNPLAPASYGDGHENVSWDPRTRQPNGIVLMSFPFGGTGRRQR